MGISVRTVDIHKNCELTLTSSFLPCQLPKDIAPCGEGSLSSHGPTAHLTPLSFGQVRKLYPVSKAFPPIWRAPSEWPVTDLKTGFSAIFPVSCQKRKDN